MTLSTSKTIKQAVVSFLILALLSGVAWVFCQVRNLPEVYAKNTVVKEEILQLKCDINSRIDRLEDYLDKRMTRLEDKFDTVVLNLSYLKDNEGLVSTKIGGDDDKSVLSR